MSEEKLYIICEVDKVGNGKISDGICKYKPIDVVGHRDEFMWLHPSRIIKQSQLEYADSVHRGDIGFLYNNDNSIVLKEWNDNCPITSKRLIIKPYKEKPKSKWDQWAEECPACCNEETQKAVAEWLKREPEKD